jgi:FKBP-type peptidyl-prolyl cis-trans isomerase FkpA
MKKIFFILLCLCCSLAVIAQSKPKSKVASKNVSAAKKTTSKGKGKTIAKNKKYNSKEIWKKTPTGLKYIHHIANKTQKAQLNEVVVLHYIMTVQTNGKDSIIRNTFKEPLPFALKVSPPSFKGSLEEGFTMVAKNDSISFSVKADSLFKQGFPPFVDKGSQVRFDMRILDITTEQAFAEARQREMESKINEQKTKDDEIIRQFLKDNNIANAQKTESGLYYVIGQTGEGEALSTGKKVSVHYLGKLLNGNKFDSSYDRGQPLDFNYNQGQMIKGFDEGVGFLKKGGKAVLYIPSHLAYGERGAGTIPPFSVLIFEIELVNIE